MNPEKRIQLFHAPKNDQYRAGTVSSLEAPPAGLHIIKSATTTENPEATIEVFDGNTRSLDELKKQISGDIVGATSWYSTHEPALEILKIAKEKGAMTVIGGPNIAHCPERVLKNRPYVDYVVIGDGEKVISCLVEGEPVEKIPNVYYRDQNGEIKYTFTEKAKLNTKYNLNLNDLASYSQDNPLLLSAVRGCIKATLGERCLFCSLPYKGIRLMNPKLFWEQIRELREAHGRKYFFETGDNVFVGKYLQLLLKNRPNDLQDTQLRFYASPKNLNEAKNVQLLKDLNVKEIFLGLETVNDELLQILKKDYTREDIIKALELLYEANIDVQIPFMYGIPSESNETLEENYQFAKEVIEKFPNIKKMLSGFIIPLIGTSLFEMVRNHKAIKAEYPGNLDEDDILDYDLLVRLMIKYFTKVSYEQVKDYIHKTADLIADQTKVGGFGII